MVNKEQSEAEISLQLFPGYKPTDTSILEEFRARDETPESGFIIDFLGCRIRSSSLWKEAQALAGSVLGLPIPADFHAEAVEWIGLLKAVKSAERQYVALELGAGFGPWTVGGASAAKRRGIEDLRLYAVEGDPHHFRSLTQHFLDNDLDPARHTLIQAAIGTHCGTADWAVLDEVSAANSWGCRPINTGSVDYMGREFSSTQKVDVISFSELLSRESIWDFVHIDVQGDELRLCTSSITELTDRVRWLVVATHSRKLDGDLLDLMFRSGWILEHEKPAKFTFMQQAASLESMTILDGTQVWQNPQLSKEGQALTSFSQEISSLESSLQVVANESIRIPITVKNSGSQTWFTVASTGPVRASYRWTDSQGNQVEGEGLRTDLAVAALRAGESASLELSALVPSRPGLYTLIISMVQEGVAWFCDRGSIPLVISALVRAQR